MAEQNVLTYTTTALITSTKSFIVTTPEGPALKTFYTVVVVAVS
jgi:hypothetical protein